jgi:hypothetical protein
MLGQIVMEMENVPRNSIGSQIIIGNGKTTGQSILLVEMKKVGNMR